jgi:arsenite methyltransferase
MQLMSRSRPAAASGVADSPAVLAADVAEFYDALQELLRVAQFRDRERICCYDISVTECYALGIVESNGPLMLNQLARELHLDKSTASRVVASLEDKGYLRREEDPADRRALRLRLTPSGETLHRRIRSEIEARHAALLAEIDPQARRTATALLRRLASSLYCGDAGNCAGDIVVTAEPAAAGAPCCGPSCCATKDPAGPPEGHPSRPVAIAPLAAAAEPAVRELVKERYAKAAVRARSGGGGSCCGGEGAAAGCDPISSDLYAEAETAGLPDEALRASLGCGNPTALAQLSPGETVLDLGSGGGIDVFLSARRVGPAGKVYGLDMTEEMLALARENQRRAGVENVEFLRGEIEHIPLPDNSVDVIVSNCVINLSGDKRRVLAEAFRVLKPGGRFAVSDVVVRGEMPAEVRRSLELWVGCVAGALEESEFARLLGEAGFDEARIEPTRVYEIEDAREFLLQAGLDVDLVSPQIEGRIMSAFVRARKPIN